MNKKLGYSKLIEDFLDHVEFDSRHRRYSVNDFDPKNIFVEQWEDYQPECHPAVAAIASALDAIVNEGVPADEALQIERFRGVKKQSHTRPLAREIHAWRSRQPREKWEVIEILANEWIAKNGYDITLKKSALQKIYKESRLKDGVIGSLDPRDWAKDRR